MVVVVVHIGFVTVVVVQMDWVLVVVVHHIDYSVVGVPHTGSWVVEAEHRTKEPVVVRTMMLVLVQRDEGLHTMVREREVVHRMVDSTMVGLLPR